MASHKGGISATLSFKARVTASFHTGSVEMLGKKTCPAAEKSF